MKTTHTLVAVALLMQGIPCLAASKKQAAPDTSAFYIYSDKGEKKNHYIPSGYMGNYSDIKVQEDSTDDPVDGRHCTKITVKSSNTQGAGWLGVYYQNPPNNWGTRKGGYDLSSYKRLTFWARSETDNVVIDTFKVGGITGEYGDSDSIEISGTVLTKSWKKYTIDLPSDKDWKSISGGFAWATALNSLPQEGAVFYLDEVRFEK